MNTPSDPLIGTEIAGCKVLAKIGTGGMGTVYKAYHQGLDRMICLKILAPALAKDERYIQFFMREARSAAKLEHRNIVQIFNVGVDNGVHYIAMSYIDGRPLSEIVARTGPLPFEAANRIMSGLFQALSAAHAQSIVHRDIKPSNILLAKDGEPKIVDFGLARKVHEEKQLTITGEMVGTAYFISPEQGLGKQVDNRADLYSAGATYFYILTGKYPFEGKNFVEVVHKHISEPPPNICQLRPELPLWVSGIVEKLMRKRPEDRFQSAQETLEAIERGDPRKPAAPPKPPAGTKQESGAKTAAGAPEVIPFTESLSDLLMGETLQPAPLTSIVKQPGTAAAQNAQSKSARVNRSEAVLMPSGLASKAIFKSSIFLLIQLCGLAAFLAAGIAASAKTPPQHLPFLKALLYPWLSFDFLSFQTAAAAAGLLALGAGALWQFSGVLTVKNALLGFTALLAYAAPFMSAPGTPSAAMLSNNLLNSLLARNNFLPYAAAAYLFSVHFLNRPNHKIIWKVLGSVFAVFAVFLTWQFTLFYTITPGHYSAPLLYASVGLAASALMVGFTRNQSILKDLLLPALLLASLVAMWGHSVSGYADKAFTALQQAEEVSIKNSAGQGYQEVPLISGSQASLAPENKPAQKTPEPALRKKAWRQAFAEPLLRFHKQAYSCGSYLLAALLAILAGSWFFALSLKRNTALI